MVYLVPVTIDNWKACIALKVADEQRPFVPENVYSIAEAQFYPEAKAFAIYADEREMVGFALYGRDAQRGKWKIFRLMIDAAHQRKGYGRAAMLQLIDMISRQRDADTILIAYQAENLAARKLYSSLGFIEEAENVSTSVTAQLWLSKS